MLLNYLRNFREDLPVFDSQKEEHMFHRELAFWGFPDVEYMMINKMNFPQELIDAFKLLPGLDEEIPEADEADEESK